MRDEKRNNTLLGNMRIHIAEWKALRPTPAGKEFIFVWLPYLSFR
ncbi:hypothetical protein [Enterobacter bugandensis]|nr:hypothetical protein [Enterobacter bugandensis]